MRVNAEVSKNELMGALRDATIDDATFDVREWSYREAIILRKIADLIERELDQQIRHEKRFPPLLCCPRKARTFPKLRYYLPELGEGPEDAEEIKDPPHYLSNVAEEAAEHFHSKRSGWECSWPLQFNILDDAGQEHRFVVDLESVPQFRAAKMK